MASGGNVNTDILSDETYDLLCTMCKRKDRNREAEKYCVDCQDYYCLTCVKVHDDVPSLNSHNILDKGQFPSGSSQPFPIAPTERCDRHSHKHVDMYCQNHDEVGCSTCMAVDHRPCQDTFYIPDFLQENASTSTSADIQRKLDSAAKSLTELQDKLKQEKQQLLKRKSETLKDIRKFRKEINDRLDELEKNSVDEIENICKVLIGEIDKADKLLRTNENAVQTARDKLVSTGNNLSQAFVNAKKGNKIAHIASKFSEDDKRQIFEADIAFRHDRGLIALLHEMNGLGHIKQRNIKNEDNMVSSTSTTKNQLDTSILRQMNVLLQVAGKKKYKINGRSDQYSSVRSVCALEDGTIILSDCTNKKLIRLDSSTFTVKEYCELPWYPHEVCTISKQDVAVCLQSKQAVQFISVGSRMTRSKLIKTGFDCYGLAYANGNLYIGDSGESVYIYSVSGSKLKQFNVDQSGKRLFSDIRSLAVSKDGSKIYVSDWNKGLTVLDNNGQVVGQFNGPQLKYAYSCYLTDTGSLLVCGHYSHNVLQFGPIGELIGEVVKSNEKANYMALCCDQQMSKMIVGLDSNEVEIYDLV